MKLMDASEVKMNELERLLNDPDVPMEASRVWELLEELSARPETEYALPAR